MEEQHRPNDRQVDTDGQLTHRENSFDSLRLIFAALVIFTHSWALTGVADPLEAINETTYDLGKLGVTGFFAISGYLVTLSWMRSPNPLRFFLARSVRVAPAFWIALVFSMLIAALENPEPWHFLLSVETLQWIWRNAFGLLNGYTTMTPGAFETNPIPGGANGALWTLTYELYCYGAVLLLGLFGVYHRPQWVWVVTATFLVFYYRLTLSDASRFQLGYYELYVAFLTGMLVAARGYKAGLLLASIVFACTITVEVLKLHDLHRWIALLQVVISVAIIRVANTQLLSRFSFPTGDYSFGLYVYAFPLQQLIIAWGGRGTHPLMIFALAVTLTLPVAILSWHCVEKPMLNFLRISTRRWPLLRWGKPII